MLTHGTKPQESCSYYHIYRHTTTKSYTQKPPTLVEHVDFTSAYGGQKLQQQRNALLLTLATLNGEIILIFMEGARGQAYGPPGFQNQ